MSRCRYYTAESRKCDDRLDIGDGSRGLVGGVALRGGSGGIKNGPKVSDLGG